MFANTCTSCGDRFVIFESQVLSVANTEAGILVTFTCWCDAPQTQLTGRIARTRSASALAA
jgi:hypothetical protein